MRKLSDFPLQSIADDNDLLLIWDNVELITKAIRKGSLLAGISSSGSGGSGLQPWQFKSSDYTAVNGDRLIVDTSSSSWMLALPSSPNFGAEIELLGLKGLNSNPLNLNVGTKLFNTKSPKNIKLDTLLTPARLIYTLDEIGWLDLSKMLKTAGAYDTEVLLDNPNIYLRLNETNGTRAVDLSGNNADCAYQGSPLFQQESSSKSDLDNKSVSFNGSTTRIIWNPTITSPATYYLECKFKTPNPNGGLFGFVGSGYDRDLYLVNGQLRLLNFNGATITSPKTYNDNQWHVVTATTNSRGAEIWVDGELVINSGDPSTVSYSGNWLIGYGQYGGYFNGLIDEVSIIHSLISQDRIKTRHAAALA